jgi:hypothetical protein
VILFTASPFRYGRLVPSIAPTRTLRACSVRSLYLLYTAPEELSATLKEIMKQLYVTVKAEDIELSAVRVKLTRAYEVVLLNHKLIWILLVLAAAASF